MNLVIVTPYSWSVPGGVNNHVAAQARHMRERGHRVTILAPCDIPATDDVMCVGKSAGVPYNGSVARIAFGPRVSARVRTALRSIAPDIVHVHEPFAPSVSMLAAFSSRVPIVATFHAAARGSRAMIAAKPLLGRVWRRCAARIAVSEEARRTVEQVFGDGCVVIPNGVEVERFASVGPRSPASRNILFIGRLEDRKGASVLLDAFEQLERQMPDVTLVVVGEGAQRKALERRAEGRAIRFLGSIEAEDLTSQIEASALVCVPSLGSESFGIVLLEAMAAGRPVVASDIPGYAAVARNGIDGLLVPPGDAAALADAIFTVLTDTREATALIANGRARAREFAWDSVVQRIEEVYARVLADA